jgi:four helix bundle protein
MNNAHQQLSNLKKCAFTYALEGIRLCQFLQTATEPVGKFFAQQYLSSVTLIGTNLAEIEYSDAPNSVRKNYIQARKEARKSLYILNLLDKANLVPPNRIKVLITDTEKLITLITKLIFTTEREQKFTIDNE